MLDVRLISVIPAQPSIAQPGTAQTVTTQAGAPVLPQLPNGTVLSGFIINRDPSGNPILRTETGDVIFASNFFLKIGSEVVLRLQTTAGKQAAHLISVNGQPPEVAASQSAFSDEPDIIIGQKQPITREQTQATQQTAPAAQAAASTLPKIGQTISGIVITPAFTPALPATVAPGTSLLLSVLGFTLPATQPASSSALTQLTTPGAQPAAPPATNNALASLLPATPQPAQPAAPSPPTAQAAIPTAAPGINSAPSAISNQQAAQSSLAAPLGQTMLGIVAATHDDGAVTLQTPLGVVRVANMPNLPVGQPIAVRVSSVAVPNNYTLSVASNAEPLPAAPLTELARSWTSLGQLAQLLGNGDDTQLAIPTIPTMATGNPNIPAQITRNASQIMFFISALKGGNFRDWLGAGNIRALEEKGYGSLVKKAESEFMQIARQFAETQPGNWQAAFIPILAGQELQQLRAFIKREKKKDEGGKPTGEEDTRFVLEMELSQLGEMQMDGLVKRREQLLQFDLVIRSHHPLQAQLQRDIQEIYASTAELTGYQGQLLFQTAPLFPIHPLEDTITDASPDVIA